MAVLNTWKFFAVSKVSYNWNAAWNEGVKNFMSNAHATT